MDNVDIEAIERTTVAAVGPEVIEACDGWLLPFDPSGIGRATAAVPLRHRVADASGAIHRVADRYRQRGRTPVFRLADAPGLKLLQAELQRRGATSDSPTQVQVGAASQLSGFAGASRVAVDLTPDAAWMALFLGDGWDALERAHRVCALARVTDSAYASVRAAGETLSAGAITFGAGWASVHSLRTKVAHQGTGLAGQVLAALAQAARARGIERLVLQVEEGNAPALALYRRAGFQKAWVYRYWRIAAMG